LSMPFGSYLVFYSYSQPSISLPPLSKGSNIKIAINMKKIIINVIFMRKVVFWDNKLDAITPLRTSQHMYNR